MRMIDHIKAWLADHPDVEYVEAETSLRIGPIDADGFSITAFQLGNQVTIVFGEGWHEVFTDLDEAVRCIAFGLSEKCRLKTTYCGSTPYRWVVEHHDDGEWVEVMTTGHFYLAFWRPKKIVYRQNAVLAWN